MKKLVLGCSWSLILLVLAGCAHALPRAVIPGATAAPTASCTLRLATTTSTADSGLLDALLPDFETKFNCRVDVIAVGTGQALEIGRRGDADVVLVHARPQEEQFVAAGHARERFALMYNDFILVGPIEDPAKVASAHTAREAFRLIARARSPFVSRGDKSGTHSKELAIWASANLTPTRELGWYNSLGQGMGETLLVANEMGAYALTDRGTYLAMKDKLSRLTILVGGETIDQNPDPALLNPYGILAVNPDKHPGVRFEMAMKLIRWFLAPETQKALAAFGVSRHGQPLFYPNAPGMK